MKKLLNLIWKDFLFFIEYRLFYMILLLSLLFGFIIGFFPIVNPLFFIFLSLYIIPVITYSIKHYIDKEEYALSETKKTTENIIVKTVSSFMLNIIPLIIYIIVLVFVLHVRINYFLFILVYFLGSIIHILIGFIIAERAKTIISLSLTYTVYILFFSLIPFLFLYNFMPEIFNYILIFSPAYLNSVLLFNIQIGYIFSDVTLIVISLVLQFLLIVALFYMLLAKRGIKID
ncbi:MAG: hypothetical protein WCY80_02280 [Candidatus Izemoplasmatales bacterium]